MSHLAFIWHSATHDCCVGATPICNQSIVPFNTGAIVRAIDLPNADKI